MRLNLRDNSLKFYFGDLNTQTTPCYGIGSVCVSFTLSLWTFCRLSELSPPNSVSNLPPQVEEAFYGYYGY